MRRVETVLPEQIMAYAGEVGGSEAFVLVRQAYELAQRAHAGQTRRSGEPYLSHCVAVAGILMSLHMDPVTLAAGFLHDSLEDTALTKCQLNECVGPQVLLLVDGMTKLKLVGDMTSRPYEDEAESLRKLFQAMAADIRIVLLKLADRLHNMQTVSVLPFDRRWRLARETLEIWAPLADRLGIWRVKSPLEDLSFRILEPKVFEYLDEQIAHRRPSRSAFVARAIEALSDQLVQNGIEPLEVSLRPRNLYAIYSKMRRKGLAFEKVYDIHTVQVIVRTVSECYLALGSLHNLWNPVPGEFDDYIATPKENLYQSLHTAVQPPEQECSLELQVRTQEMHQVAEFGIAAIWQDCERRYQYQSLQAKVDWFRRQLQSHLELGDAREYLEAVKVDVLPEQVFVFTPKGEIVELTAGSTPIDFAYKIHTRLGDEARGVRINNMLRPLNTPLRNGDRVMIIRRQGALPRRAWLDPDLGYIKTSYARTSVRRAFRRFEGDQAVTVGRQALAREITMMGLDACNLHEVARAFSYEDVNQFLIAIARAELMPTTVSSFLMQGEWDAMQPAGRPVTKTGEQDQVQVNGVPNLRTRLCGFCRPAFGDPVVGNLLRRGRVTVHRVDCPQLRRLSPHGAPLDLVEVSWLHEAAMVRPVFICVAAFDRSGLVHDVTRVLECEQINIRELYGCSDDERQTGLVTLTVDIRDLRQLARVLHRISQLPNVKAVRRSPQYPHCQPETMLWAVNSVQQRA